MDNINMLSDYSVNHVLAKVGYGMGIRPKKEDEEIKKLIVGAFFEELLLFLHDNLPEVEASMFETEIAHLKPDNADKINKLIYQYFRLIPHAKVKLDTHMRVFANSLIAQLNARH